MKKTAGYVISHNNKTITLTKAYAKKANTPGTKEFKELANLHKAYPDYDIVMRTATVSESKEKHGGLTVEVMEKIIARQPNAEALKKEYDEFVAFWGKEVEDISGKGYLKMSIFSALFGKKKDETPAVKPSVSKPAKATTEATPSLHLRGKRERARMRSRN